MQHAGNEGRGLRTNIRRVCTGLVRVDMGKQGQGFTGLGVGSNSSSSSDSGISSQSKLIAGMPGGVSSGRGVNSESEGEGSVQFREGGGRASYWGGSGGGTGEEVLEWNPRGDFNDESEGDDGDVRPRGGARRGESRSHTPAGVDSLNVSVATGILLHSLTASAARHAAGL